MKLDIEEERERLVGIETFVRKYYPNSFRAKPEFIQQQKLVAALEQLEQAREALSWAEGQFAGIRMYTQDGKVAVACADGEARIKQALKQQEVE